MQNSKENLDLNCYFPYKYKFQLGCLAFKDLNRIKFTKKKKKRKRIHSKIFSDGKGRSF